MSICSKSAVAGIVVAVLGAACGSSTDASGSIGTGETETTASVTTALARSLGAAETTSVTSPEPSPEPSPPAARTATGRLVPIAPASAAEAAQMFIDVEHGLRDDQRLDEFADLGHQEQVIIRSVARNDDWADEFLSALSPELTRVAELHLAARAELGRLHTAPPLERIPAWKIVDPEPLDDLMSHYREAEAATGIDWRVLAAINLIETGMGRIVGLSSAGAQGPMQFLPTTWEEVADGGDINDADDAIQGAARYLVRRGGLDDIRDGLWGYNNSDNYVNAVLTYVELLETDERALRGLYNWEIYVGTDAGTLWLPVGFSTDEPLPANRYLSDNPWARTL